jgi:hypothetical protein
MHAVLPALLIRLTPAQVEWLRQAFAQYPMAVLGGIVAVVTVLGLPVLVVFRWTYGPLDTLPARGRGTDRRI